MTKGWVDSFRGRDHTEFIETTSTPQEERWLQVPRIFLGESTWAMNEAGPMLPSDLVFGLDEVGISKWGDCKSKLVVVPTTANDRPVHHGESGNRRCPSATVSRIGTNLILRQRNKAYINSKLFVHFSRHVFLPHLSNLGRFLELAHEEVVSLMDNGGPHMPEELINFLAQARVRVVTVGPHITKIFRVLDLTLFGVFKHRGHSHLPVETENRTSDFTFKTDKDFHATMIGTNI
jgi:hypothetical protein